MSDANNVSGDATTPADTLAGQLEDLIEYLKVVYPYTEGSKHFVLIRDRDQISLSLGQHLFTCFAYECRLTAWGNLMILNDMFLKLQKVLPESDALINKTIDSYKNLAGKTQSHANKCQAFIRTMLMNRTVSYFVEVLCKKCPGLIREAYEPKAILLQAKARIRFVKCVRVLQNYDFQIVIDPPNMPCRPVKDYPEMLKKFLERQTLTGQQIINSDPSRRQSQPQSQLMQQVQAAAANEIKVTEVVNKPTDQETIVTVSAQITNNSTHETQEKEKEKEKEEEKEEEKMEMKKEVENEKKMSAIPSVLSDDAKTTEQEENPTHVVDTGALNMTAQLGVPKTSDDLSSPIKNSEDNLADDESDKKQKEELLKQEAKAKEEEAQRRKALEEEEKILLQKKLEEEKKAARAKEQKRIEEEQRARDERERSEREKLEQERLEREKIEREKLERERIEKEKLELEKLKRLEQERLERIESERIAKEKLQKEKIERERAEKEQQQKLEKEKAEKAEKERLERLEREKLEKQRLEKEKAEKERAERERAEKLEKEKLEIAEKEKLERERRERLERERRERERLEKERLEKERIEKDKAEKLRLEKEKAEKLEKERLEKEKLEKQRLEKERLDRERERLEKERIEKERIAKEKKEREEKDRLEREKKEKEEFEQQEKKRKEEERIESEKKTKDEAEKQKILKEENERKTLEKAKEDLLSDEDIDLFTVTTRKRSNTQTNGKKRPSSTMAYQQSTIGSTLNQSASTVSLPASTSNTTIDVNNSEQCSNVGNLTCMTQQNSINLTTSRLGDSTLIDGNGIEVGANGENTHLTSGIGDPSVKSNSLSQLHYDELATDISFIQNVQNATQQLTQVNSPTITSTKVVDDSLSPPMASNTNTVATTSAPPTAPVTTTSNTNNVNTNLIGNTVEKLGIFSKTSETIEPSKKEENASIKIALDQTTAIAEDPLKKMISLPVPSEIMRVLNDNKCLEGGSITKDLASSMNEIIKTTAEKKTSIKTINALTDKKSYITVQITKSNIDQAEALISYYLSKMTLRKQILEREEKKSNMLSKICNDLIKKKVAISKDDDKPPKLHQTSNATTKLDNKKTEVIDLKLNTGVAAFTVVSTASNNNSLASIKDRLPINNITDIQIKQGDHKITEDQIFEEPNRLYCEAKECETRLKRCGVNLSMMLPTVVAASELNGHVYQQNLIIINRSAMRDQLKSRFKTLKHFMKVAKNLGKSSSSTTDCNMCPSSSLVAGVKNYDYDEKSKKFYLKNIQKRFYRIKKDEEREKRADIDEFINSNKKVFNLHSQTTRFKENISNMIRLGKFNHPINIHAFEDTDQIKKEYDNAYSNYMKSLTLRYRFDNMDQLSIALLGCNNSSGSGTTNNNDNNSTGMLSSACIGGGMYSSQYSAGSSSSAKQAQTPMENHCLTILTDILQQFVYNINSLGDAPEIASKIRASMISYNKYFSILNPQAFVDKISDDTIRKYSQGKLYYDLQTMTRRYTPSNVVTLGNTVIDLYNIIEIFLRHFINLDSSEATQSISLSELDKYNEDLILGGLLQEDNAEDDGEDDDEQEYDSLEEEIKEDNKEKKPLDLNDIIDKHGLKSKFGNYSSHTKNNGNVSVGNDLEEGAADQATMSLAALSPEQEKDIKNRRQIIKRCCTEYTNLKNTEIKLATCKDNYAYNQNTANSFKKMYKGSIVTEDTVMTMQKELDEQLRRYLRQVNIFFGYIISKVYKNVIEKIIDDYIEEENQIKNSNNCGLEDSRVLDQNLMSSKNNNITTLSESNISNSIISGSISNNSKSLNTDNPVVRLVSEATYGQHSLDRNNIIIWATYCDDIREYIYTENSIPTMSVIERYINCNSNNSNQYFSVNEPEDEDVGYSNHGNFGEGNDFEQLAIDKLSTENDNKDDLAFFFPDPIKKKTYPSQEAVRDGLNLTSNGSIFDDLTNTEMYSQPAISPQEHSLVERQNESQQFNRSQQGIVPFRQISPSQSQHSFTSSIQGYVIGASQSLITVNSNECQYPNDSHPAASLQSMGKYLDSRWYAQSKAVTCITNMKPSLNSIRTSAGLLRTNESSLTMRRVDGILNNSNSVAIPINLKIYFVLPPEELYKTLPMETRFRKEVLSSIGEHIPQITTETDILTLLTGNSSKISKFSSNISNLTVGLDSTAFTNSQSKLATDFEIRDNGATNVAAINTNTTTSSKQLSKIANILLAGEKTYPLPPLPPLYTASPVAYARGILKNYLLAQPNTYERRGFEPLIGKISEKINLGAYVALACFIKQKFYITKSKAPENESNTNILQQNLSGIVGSRSKLSKPNPTIKNTAPRQLNTQDLLSSINIFPTIVSKANFLRNYNFSYKERCDICLRLNSNNNNNIQWQISPDDCIWSDSYILQKPDEYMSHETLLKYSTIEIWLQNNRALRDLTNNNSDSISFQGTTDSNIQQATETPNNKDKNSRHSNISSALAVAGFFSVEESKEKEKFNNVSKSNSNNLNSNQMDTLDIIASKDQLLKSRFGSQFTLDFKNYYSEGSQRFYQSLDDQMASNTPQNEEIVTSSDKNDSSFVATEHEACIKIRCADCNKSFEMSVYSYGSQFCSYTGAFYCKSCMQSVDMSYIPQKIASSFDFRPYPVCKKIKQFLFNDIILDIPCVTFNEMSIKNNSGEISNNFKSLLACISLRKRIQSALLFLSMVHGGSENLGDKKYEKLFIKNFEILSTENYGGLVRFIKTHEYKYSDNFMSQVFNISFIPNLPNTGSLISGNNSNTTATSTSTGVKIDLLKNIDRRVNALHLGGGSTLSEGELYKNINRLTAPKNYIGTNNIRDFLVNSDISSQISNSGSQEIIAAGKKQQSTTTIVTSLNIKETINSETIFPPELQFLAKIPYEEEYLKINSFGHHENCSFSNMCNCGFWSIRSLFLVKYGLMEKIMQNILAVIETHAHSCKFCLKSAEKHLACCGRGENPLFVFSAGIRTCSSCCCLLHYDCCQETDAFPRCPKCSN